MPLAALAVLLVTLVAGADFAILISFERVRTRILISALLGFAAALVFYAAPTAKAVTGQIYIDALGLAIASAAVPFLFSGVIRILLPRRGGAGIAGYRRVLNGALWPGNVRRRALTPTDWARRWFVTVAAATGGVVGSAAAQGWFWDSIGRALAPERIIFVIVLTAVSVFVIGPVEDFVFHPHAAAGEDTGDDTSVVADMVSHMSVRQAGRLVLVLAAFFAANVVHSCFADGASQRSVGILVAMVVAGVAPGVVTYYWATALQVGADSVRRRAGWASTVMGAFLCGAFFIKVTADTIDPLLPDEFMLRLLIVLAVVPTTALAFSLLVMGSLAYLGGATLDWTRHRPVLPAWLAFGVLAAIVAAASTASVAFSEAVVAPLVPAALPHLPSLTLPLCVTAGWMLALGVSDFPRIVTEARAQTGTGADMAKAQPP